MGKNDNGVLQNYEYTRSDGGKWGYVHNSRYIKRIIFDSVNWLKNGNFNTATITIPAAYPDARAWFNADSNGVATRP